MTPRERAEDLVRRFDEPVMDKTNYRVQAMISMTEQAIIAAVEEDRARRELALTETQLAHRCQCSECDPPL